MDDPVRLTVSKTGEKHPVHYAEHPNVRADAQGEGGCRDKGEEWSPD